MSPRSRPFVVMGVAAISAVVSACASLRGVNVDVHVAPGSDNAATAVEVELWQQKGCMVASPGTAVAINGQAAALVLPGRQLSETTRMLQIELPFPNCEPVLFRSPPLTGPPAARDTIQVEIAGRRGVVEIDNLRAARTLRIISPQPLVPGHAIEIEWLPASDVWPPRTPAVEVRIERAGLRRVSIEGNALKLKENRIAFTMPEMPPGPVTLSVRPGESGPRARVAGCRGFGQCGAGRVPWPSPIAAEVR